MRHVCGCLLVVACIAVIALWIGTYRFNPRQVGFKVTDVVPDAGVGSITRVRFLSVQSHHGSFAIAWGFGGNVGRVFAGGTKRSAADARPPRGSLSWGCYRSVEPPMKPTLLGRIGFAYVENRWKENPSSYEDESHVTGIFFPHWVVLVVLAAFAARFLRTLRSKSGTQQPSCPCRTCGYDLRASHDRCPECGHQIPG